MGARRNRHRAQHDVGALEGSDGAVDGRAPTAGPLVEEHRVPGPLGLTMQDHVFGNEKKVQEKQEVGPEQRIHQCHRPSGRIGHAVVRIRGETIAEAQVVPPLRQVPLAQAFGEDTREGSVQVKWSRTAKVSPPNSTRR